MSLLINKISKKAKVYVSLSSHVKPEQIILQTLIEDLNVLNKSYEKSLTKDKFRWVFLSLVYRSLIPKIYGFPKTSKRGTPLQSFISATGIVLITSKNLKPKC